MSQQRPALIKYKCLLCSWLIIGLLATWSGTTKSEEMQLVVSAISSLLLHGSTLTPTKLMINNTPIQRKNLGKQYNMKK